MIASATTVAPSRPNGKRSLELADIFRQFGPSYLRDHKTSYRHRKVLQQIVNCRTAMLGGHRHWCAACDYQRYVYHSCRNRHCPKCQVSAKEAWREARQLELLRVPYFHNVFTLPHELNALILFSEQNQRALLDLLFKATKETLLEFGRSTFGGQIGFTAVLHTWDQRLNPHFHLHCLIPSGALKATGETNQWVAGGRKFLFPVKALSVMFRAKFLVALKKMFAKHELGLPAHLLPASQTKQLIQKLFKKPWVIYSKAPFAGPRKLLDYLSRYTHRVALTNSRLLACEGDQVTMSFRDRRDGDRRKTMVLPAKELIGRFLKHVLPSNSQRIRHYGFLANRYKKVRLATIRALLGITVPVAADGPSTWLTDWIQAIVGAAENTCPCCGSELSSQLQPAEITQFMVGSSCTAQPIETNNRGSP